MIDVERELRTMFSRRERDALDLAPGRPVDPVVRRTHRRQARNAIVAAMVTGVLVIGSVAGAQTLLRERGGGRPASDDRASSPRARSRTSPSKRGARSSAWRPSALPTVASAST